MNAGPSPGAFSSRELRLLLWAMVAAVLWRHVLALRTPVPAEDGVNYLWMAQQFAAGDWQSPLTEPFPPLWPLLVAIPVACGADPFGAAQVFGCVFGGLALWPVAAAAQRLRPGAGVPAAMLLLTSSLLARTAAEAYTEPLFVLLCATTLCLGTQQRFWLAGVVAGLAFWTRPEALGLPPALLLAVGWTAARALPGFAMFALALAAWRGAAGQGFDPLPILEFHAQRDDLPSRGDWLRNLVDLPGAWAEAFGLAGGLALLAASRPRPRQQRLFLLALVIGVLGVLSFVVRRRFLLSWAPCVVVLAGVGLAPLSRWLQHGLLLFACGLDLWTGFHGTIGKDRIAERLVGQHLATRLLPGELVAGDMTRVLFYSGVRPLPPRHFNVPALLGMAHQPAVRFVVLSENSPRASFADVVAGLGPGFVRYELPRPLSELAARRGVAVWQRRP